MSYCNLTSIYYIDNTITIGKDATEAFEDIGHSDEAREILEKYLVGTLDEEVKIEAMMIRIEVYVYIYPVLEINIYTYKNDLQNSHF